MLGMRISTLLRPPIVLGAAALVTTGSTTVACRLTAGERGPQISPDPWSPPASSTRGITTHLVLPQDGARSSPDRLVRARPTLRRDVATTSITASVPAILALDRGLSRNLGGGSRNRTGVHGFAGRCMTTLPSRQGTGAAAMYASAAEKRKGEPAVRSPRESGAGNESRTRDLNLGKVALYQLSYSRGGSKL